MSAQGGSLVQPDFPAMELKASSMAALGVAADDYEVRKKDADGGKFLEGRLRLVIFYFFGLNIIVWPLILFANYTPLIFSSHYIFN